MKKIIIAGLVFGILIIGFALGPKVPEPNFNSEFPIPQTNLVGIENAIQEHEELVSLRPDNQAQIVWADSLRKTPYAILYLHGFSASSMEGDPVHREIARHFGVNLYLARLSGHGYRTNNLEDFTAESGWNSAKKALAQAQLLGDSIIIMGTSTGCTYALMLAAHFPEKVHALINYSPNIRVRNPAAFLLDGPWGREIGKLVMGEKRYIKPDTPAYGKYWDTLYTMDAVVELQSLLEAAMVPATFKNIHCPTLNLYYYKSKDEQDAVVDVNKIKWMHQKLATPKSQKWLVALAGPENHVLASPIKSKDITGVQQQTLQFCREVLKMKPR